MVEIDVANVVGTITYRQELALKPLAETFSKREEINSVTYEPADAHWLQTWFSPDDTYVAFYRGGRCSIAGCSSVDHFNEVVERVNNIMRELLEFEYEPTAEVSNIVATADINLTVSLEALTIGLGLECTEYEPEQFPALMYRGTNYVILVFSSGKLLCTGLDDIDAVAEAVEDITSRINAVV